MPEPSSFFRRSHVFLSPHHQPGTPWSWTPTFSSIQKGWNYLFQFNLAKWRAQDARLLFIALISKQASYLAPKLQDNSSDFPACFSWGQNGDFSYAAVMTHKQLQNLEKDQFKCFFFFSYNFFTPLSPGTFRTQERWLQKKSFWGDTNSHMGESPCKILIPCADVSWRHMVSGFHDLKDVSLLNRRVSPMPRFPWWRPKARIDCGGSWMVSGLCCNGLVGIRNNIIFDRVLHRSKRGIGQRGIRYLTLRLAETVALASKIKMKSSWFCPVTCCRNEPSPY